MNLVEVLLYEPQICEVRTLIKGVRLTSEERAYFREYLEEYGRFEVFAYDLREILCEKVRAILTRRVQKLRDFYDLYMLMGAGLNIEDYAEEIARKLEPVLRYKKYREAFERNRKGLHVALVSMADSYELSLFVKQLDREKFRDFLARIGEKLGEIVDYVWF